MSDLKLVLPPGLVLPAGVGPQDAPEETVSDVEKGHYLPRPAGYKLLCAIPEMQETFDGSNIVRPDAVTRQEEHATAVLFVLAMGPEAYKDEKKFPHGPWCTTGDFVMVRTYSGTRFKIFGKEMRLINDDMVEAIVDDPRGISRA